MKRIIIIVFVLTVTVEVTAQQMKIVSIVESVDPVGVGRSRILEHQESVDAAHLTTERTDGKSSRQNKIKRKEAKIENLKETKLLNIFNGFGINFQNVASNDALITSKINEMIADGWVLSFVTSAVESIGGKGDDSGIFITRLFFTKH